MHIAAPPDFSIRNAAMDGEIFPLAAAWAIVFTENFAQVFGEEGMTWVAGG